MINFRLVVIGLHIIAFTLVGIRGSMAERQSQSDRLHEPLDTNYGLQLSVKLKDTVVQINSKPQIIVRLKNVSDKPITIYKNLAWGQGKSLSLFIEVIRGKLDGPTFLEEVFFRPPFPKEDFIPIQPGEFIEVKRSISLRNFGVMEPGDYRIIVRYRSPIPEDFVPAGLEVWAMEYGALQTKPVDLKVTQ